MSTQRKLLQSVIDWYEKDSSVGGLQVLIDEIETEIAKPEQKQVGAMGLSGPVLYKKIEPGTPLYTSPRQHDPLSDDEIMAMSRMFKINYFPPDGAILNFVRLIEKRITEGK